MDEDVSPKTRVQSHKPNAGTGSAPERWVSILGFVIVTKADLLAAAAFLLSLVSLLYQLSGWIKGPEPSVYPPDLVYVFFDRYANNRTVVRFASQLSLVNTADLGHDAIMRDVTLKVSAPGLDISQEWLSFVKIERDGTRLTVMPKEAAHPFPVVASGAASNTVSFAPLEEPCNQSSSRPTSDSNVPACDPDRYYVSDADFLNKIADARSMEVTFRVRFVGFGKDFVTSCTIPIGNAFRQYIAENDWFAARCYPKPAGS